MFVQPDVPWESIAESLKTLVAIEHDKAPEWVSPAVSVVTTLLTVWVTYRAAMDAVQRPERERLAAQRSQIHDMLRDEINRRWRRNMRRDFIEIIKRPTMGQVRLIAGMELSLDDLPVLKCMRERFSEFHFVGDATFVSACVYASVLVHDLVDLRVWAKTLVKRAEAAPYLLEPFCAADLDEWRAFRKDAEKFKLSLRDKVKRFDRVTTVIHSQLLPRRRRIKLMIARSDRWKFPHPRTFPTHLGQ